MNKYPRSIRYALSTYSNNLKKERNKSESQRLYSQGNIFSNSINNDDNSNINESLYPYNYPYNNNFNNKYHYNINQDIDDLKNQTEARQLIEQTRKMMEEYSQNKLKNQNGKKNPINQKKAKNKNQIHNSNFKNKSTSNFDLHLNINTNNYLDNNKKNSLLNKDYFDQLAGKPDSIDTLTQKLIYKNKEIKILERELKERTNQLKVCQDKKLKRLFEEKNKKENKEEKENMMNFLEEIHDDKDLNENIINENEKDKKDEDKNDEQKKENDIDKKNEINVTDDEDKNEKEN